MHVCVLKKFYSFYTAIVGGIVSRCGLTVEVCHRNQPNKNKLVLYKPLLSLKQSFKTAECNSKTERFIYKSGCDVYLSKKSWLVPQIQLCLTLINTVSLH